MISDERQLKIAYAPFSVQLFQEAILEATLDPPRQGTIKGIGGYWYIWDNGTWSYPRVIDLKQLAEENTEVVSDQ